MPALGRKRSFIIPTSFYLLRRTVIHSQFNVPPATLRKALKVVLFTQMRLPAAMFFWTSAFAFLFTVILPLKVSFSMTFAGCMLKHNEIPCEHGVGDDISNGRCLPAHQYELPGSCHQPYCSAVKRYQCLL